VGPLCMHVLTFLCRESAAATFLLPGYQHDHIIKPDSVCGRQTSAVYRGPPAAQFSWQLLCQPTGVRLMYRVLFVLQTAAAVRPQFDGVPPPCTVPGW